MADLTPQQIQGIQAIAAQVETAHREITRSRTYLSILINAGRATCTDVKTYNLLAKSTYFYQKSMADTIRGSGGQPPEVSPPLYVGWKGVSGDQFANVDCSTAQLAGAGVPNGLGDFFIDPMRVEWRSGALPSDQQAIAQMFAGVQLMPEGANPNGLGNPLLVAVVPVIIWGVIITITGYIVLKIVEVFKDVPGKVEYTRQTAIAAERHRATLEARAKCLTDCAAAGKDPIACAKSCAKVLPDYHAPSPYSGGIGIFGWVLGAILVGGAAWVGWRLVTGRGLLPGGGGVDGADDDEDGDYDDDDVIDVVPGLERIG
jgi:hypothetical protein